MLYPLFYSRSHLFTNSRVTAVTASPSPNGYYTLVTAVNWDPKTYIYELQIYCIRIVHRIGL
jgi:hypothetical protein